MTTRSERLTPGAAGGDAVELGELIRRTLHARTHALTATGHPIGATGPHRPLASAVSGYGAASFFG